MFSIYSQAMDRIAPPFADDEPEMIADWKAKVQRLGQQAIGQLDCKITALQAITLEGNRTANRLEVFVEHLEQVTQKQIEWQRLQIAYRVHTNTNAMSMQSKPEPVETLSAAIPAAKLMPDAAAYTDVLKEIAEIAEGVDGVSEQIRQSTTLGDQPELAELLRQFKQQEEPPPPAKLTEELCREAEMLSNFGLEPPEIAQRLGVPSETLDLLLQIHQNIDTITETVTTPLSNMSDFDDFDGFVEADDARSTISPKAITDTFKNPPAFKMGIVGVGQCGNNIAQAFYRIGYRRVLLVNTAQTDLDSIEDQITKLPIDKQGAGKDPTVGKARVEAKATEIRNGILREFGDDFDKIIVCLGLGGGTGSGGGPAVIKIAQDIIKARGGNPAKDVIVIVTLPDPNMDGPRQCFNALAAYGQIAQLGVPLTIIDNAQVGSIIRAKLAEGWTPINTWIARTFHMFNAYANMPSDHGAFDGNDFNDVISRGRLLFSAFRVTNLKDRYAIGDTMAANLERSLFAKCDRASATAAGCLLVINPRIGNDLSMEDLAPALQELNNIMQPNSTLHRGIYIPDWSFNDQDKHPDLFCYVILGGLDHPRVTLAGLFDKAKSFDQRYESVEAFLAAQA